MRWHVARLIGRVLHRRAFGDFGRGTVIVRPRRLQNVDRIHIGERCAVYEGAWLATEGGAGPLHIGDDVYIGQDVHLHAHDPVRIGSGSVLADGVFVGSSDHGRIDRHAVHPTGPIHIGERVFVGQRAVVLGGVTIGEGATIGAHAVVTRDVPAGATVVGVPARVVERH
ncbi:hypothetical protein GCM10027425_03020 [Alteromonas gracilis]